MKNHVRHGLEELFGIVKGYRPTGIAEPHFLKAMQELEELERLAEIGRAVEWALEAYGADSHIQYMLDDYYIYDGKNGIWDNLLEKYRLKNSEN